MAPDFVSALLIIAVAAFVSAHLVRAFRRGAFVVSGKPLARDQRPVAFWSVMFVLGAVTITLLVRALQMLAHSSP